MNKICLIIAAVFFGLGAIAATAKIELAINWTNAGLCMVTIAAIIGH